MWYNLVKTSQIINPKDKQVLSTTIHHLEDICATLKKLNKLVIQTNRGAKGMMEDLVNNKCLSSYPKIVEILVKADECALDSPKRFSELCNEAYEKLVLTIKKLKQQYKDLIKDMETK